MIKNYELDKEDQRKRLKVLKYALLLENFVSHFLANLLDIDINNSRTMSNKSSALGFKNKIDLLTDINSVGQEDAKKFLDFMIIRNQFLHNLDANSFESCFEFIDGMGNRLRKLYPQDKTLPLEVQYEKCFDALVEDLINTIMLLFDKVQQKIQEEVSNSIIKEKYQELVLKIKTYSTNYEEE